MDATSSALAGGLSFSPLQVGGGTDFGSSTGGLHFDLPLASIQAFTSQAMSFTAATAHQDQGFLAGILSRSRASVDAASQRSAGINLAAINAGYAIGAGNINLADSISARAASVATFNIASQTAIAKYLSDNAARVAITQANNQTEQVKTQNKGKGATRIIGSLLSGGLF